MSNRRLSLVVLVSGSGSNLQAIIDAAADGHPFEVCAVISNRADAYGLKRAQQAGIETRVLANRDFPDRERYDQALGDLIEEFQPGLVILAGFMRILTAPLVERFQGRMLNIHPSLLPKYKGLHTHQRALDDGELEHGASVHFVTEELDGGPVIIQAKVPVLPTDDEATLASRVLEQEHVIYPTVIGWIAEGRLTMQQGDAVMDGEILTEPVLFTPKERSE